MHNNMVTVDGIKMGKSLGNFKTCEDLLSKHTPEAIRVFLLSTHYRSPSNYTEEAIEAAAVGLSRLSQLYQALNEITSAGEASKSPMADEQILKICEKAESEICERLNDDLDTPGAIAKIYGLVSDVNRIIAADKISSATANKVIETLKNWAGDILGILPDSENNKSDLNIEPLMDLVIDFRANMKSQKRYDVADSIRDKLKEAGIVIEDTKSGVRWKKGQ